MSLAGSRPRGRGHRAGTRCRCRSHAQNNTVFRPSTGAVAVVELHPQARLRDPRPSPAPVLATPPPLGFRRPTAASSAQIPDTSPRPASDTRHPSGSDRPTAPPAHRSSRHTRQPPDAAEQQRASHRPAHAPRPNAAIAPGQRRRSTQRPLPGRESFGRQSAPARHQGTHEPRLSAAVAAVPAHDWPCWPFLCRRGPRHARTGHRMDDISVQQVLEVVGHVDESGGARVSLIAWELSVDEQRFAPAWAQAAAEGLLRRAGRDRLDREQLWRLTAGG